MNKTKSILTFIICISILGLTYYLPESYKLFGKMSWLLLIIIVYSRPLSNIFPKLNFVKTIVGLRKEIGIICGVSGLAHGIGYFLFSDLSIIKSLSNSNYFSLENGYGWGLRASIVCIPLLITSNNFMIKVLKQHWKRIQRLTYIFFLAVGIHIILLKPSEKVGTIFIITFWAILWLLAYYKVTRQNNKKIIGGIFSLGILGNIIGNIVIGHPTTENIQTDKTTLKQNNSINQSNGIENNYSSISQSKKLTISNKCIGCGKCIRIDPNHFSMDRNNYIAIVSNQENLSTNALNHAIKDCPVDAIKLG